MVTLLLTLACGQMWGTETVLKTIDFSTWGATTFSQGNTETADVHNGVTFYSKNSSKQFSFDASKHELTFPNNNGSSSNYGFGFLVEGINNGTIIIRVYNGEKVVLVRTNVVDGATSFDKTKIPSSSSSEKASYPFEVVNTGLSNANNKAYVYLSRQSGDYTKITKIVVSTPALTNISESHFYQLYNSSSKTAIQLVTTASLPDYIDVCHDLAIDDGKTDATTVSEVTTPHNFAGLSKNTKYYRLKMGQGQKIYLHALANVKSIRLYGNGNGSTRSVTCTATKISGTGTAPSISLTTFANAAAKVAEYSTGDLTGKSGYNTSTYYNYVFTIPNTTDIWGIYVETAAAACTVPSSVSVDGTWRRFPGETITLTATATGGVGTKTYQWQKYMVDTWTNLAGETSATFTKANCTKEDAGQYRCVVSTGATCSLASDGYNVRVYTLEGKYEGGSDVSNNITVTSGTTGTATVNLEAGRIYRFKVVDNVDKGYGNEGRILANVSGWNFWSDNANYAYLFTGPAGAYTFTVNTANADATPTPSVAVNVAYPEVSHPAEGYAYFESAGWGSVGLYMWYEGGGSYTSWDDAPLINNTVEICSKTYYYTPLIPDWYNRVIFRNKSASGQTGDITISDLASYSAKYVTSSNATWQPFSTHTITYAGNGGGGSMSATSGICPDADQVITSNAFTAPTGCASFAHWTANVAVKVSGATVAAGSPIANGATIEDINSDITLTAVWKLATPTITDNGDNTFSISGSIAGSSYYYTTNGGTPTTSSSLYSSAVDFSTGEADITAKAIAHKDGYVDSDVASQACVYHAAVTCTGSPTALVSGTLYQVSDMASACLGEITGTGQYFFGLSSNGKFYINGTTNSNNASTGTVEIKTASNTIDKINFTGIAWFKDAGTNTCRSIKFVVPSAGTLTIYGKTSSSGGNVVIKTESSGNTTVIAKSVNAYASGSTTVSAGTYYVLSDGASAAIVGLKFVESACSTPAAPTAFANTAVTSTTATFSITDAADAASYDLYYASGSPSTPTAGTNATENVTIKTPTITGLTASTTYKIWARSVCDASHKSDWVALGTTSFTTSAAEPTALVTWQMKVDQAAWALKSGTTEDGTNITSIASTADEPGSTSTGITGTTGKVVMASGESNVDKAASFTFTVNSAKKVVPEKVTCKVLNVSSGDRTYKAQLSDNNGHVYYSTNTVSVTTENVLTDATFNFASSLVLTGNVTLKVYAWKTSGSPTQFRMGEYVKLFGEVQNAADYTVTHTMSNVTKSAGATSVKEGNNYTATYAGAGGYALPSTITVTIGGSPATAGTDYTWTQGTGVVTIPGNKVTGNIVITVTGVAVVNYSITYHCNGAESGCPSNVAATTNLPSPLPTGMTKDGYDFGGWFTDSECTVAAVAGAALTGNTDLYAKWTERGSECEDTPHAWDVIATGAKSYKVRISKVTEEVAIPVADATASNLTAYAGSVSTNDNVTVQIADGGSSQYGYKFDGSNTYLKLVFSTPLVLNDTLVVGMTNASHNISFTTTAVRSTTLSTSGGKLIIPAALAGQSTIYLWRGSGSTMYLRSFAVKHACDALPSCSTPTLPTATLSNQTVCEGSDIAAWDATPTNASTISGKSESISYSWKKKGNDTELATTATFDLGASAAESQAGTYVVTVTVSKAGYASASASKEVDLTVTEGEEVTNITADKATVYPGNSVTLTATANITPDSWQWYTCNNAEGAGAAIISGAESASYTIASAGAAGTYYYKAVATGDCGTAERVYTLVVSPAAGGDCETEFWFAKAADKPEGATAATHISGTPSGSSSASYTATIDGNNYTITGQTGQKTGNVTITVPEDYEGTLYVVVQGSSSRTITLSKGGVQVGQETPANSTWGTFTFSNLDAGTYTLVSSGNIGWGILALKLCSAVACSDPEVTASADNTTACVGTSVTFTAANAHASATYQWQKLNGTWTNISGATESTYNINPVVAGDAGKYRVIASHDCNRTSNEVTLSVPSVPDFGSTVPASVSVMQTIALSINTVEATDAVKYRWYKSADGTWDAGDVEIGTNKELIKAYDSEAIGSPSYYIFCRAQNSCGITTSTAIAVNVTTYVEEDCATKGNEGEAEFEFENTSCGSGNFPNTSTPCWNTNSKSKYLTYTAPEGKYFDKAKVTVGVSGGTQAAYGYSTDGSSWTYVTLTGLTTSLAEKEIDLTGNITHFRIGRNFDPSYGQTSNTFYLSKICFEYTEACTSTTVTPSTSSVPYEMGGAWSNPTFTLSVAGTLTYSSSNEDIASVDDDGTVTFNGDAGTVTITASYAGGTISETEYCASSGSYTINVSCPGGAPKVAAASSVDLSGCNSSVTLLAKTQADGDFADGTYQWFRNGTEIDGATSSSYTATQAGIYTVERTNASGCTTPSTNSATVTSETTEPEVERLVPFQYYHVDKTYSDQMKMRHLFAVKNSGKLDGKSFKMYVSRSGGAATDVTSSNALVVVPSGDGHVDTVMVDLNKLSSKYSENDELVYTCKAIDCSGNVSEVYKNTITMRVIGSTPTLALICSGSSKAGGTRKESELTVGGDFLTGYNKADLCEQTGKESFDANTEWGLYTRLKANYIVTPVNGYAVFNKLNYEPFDILLLTDYPKASKSDAAKDVLDDMADLCDYRPMLSFKAHMVAKSPSKWAAKGFTTAPVAVKQGDGRTHLNIVCYAHPMFDGIKDAGEHIFKDNDATGQIVYEMLTGTGYESSKGIQGFEIAAAENFVTIGLIHYNASVSENDPSTGMATWTGGTDKESGKPNDRILVAAVERQANPEARMVMLAVNCGAQSKFTETGRTIVHKCLQYLLSDYTITPMADCSFTFDNGAGALHDADWYKDEENCPGCTGTLGDGLWSTAANWAPDRLSPPGKDTEVKIAAPVTVDMAHAIARSARIVEGGHISIPAGNALEIIGTIRRLDGSEISPTENSDIFIGSTSAGNGTLIFNNDKGDSKATVAMYTTAKTADPDPVTGKISAAASTWQYIGTPHNDVAVATYNYYDSWLYQYDTGTEGWTVIPNGGPLVPFRGYCVTHPEANHTFVMGGKLTATTSQEIAIPAGKFVVVANSWTAPIYVKNITAEDMENTREQTIYFFNTGSDSEQTGTVANGTYVAVPVHASSYTGDSLISSMQGFYVVGGGSDGTLHLDYERHVRPTNNRNIKSGPMHAPQHYAVDDEPIVAKLFFRGSRYSDRLVVLERADFSRGFDNGWDGEAWGGNDAAPYSCVSGENRWDAVSAIPDFEGTVVGFQAGEDNEYRIDFEYSEENEPLYLLDTDNNTYTRVLTGNTYQFTTSDKDYHDRFLFTRMAPQVATGYENLDGGEGAKAKKLLIEDKMYIMLNGMLYDATGKVVK